MQRIAVIDGDTVAYRCAAANEKRSVICTHKDSLFKAKFNTVTDFRTWLSTPYEGVTYTESEFDVIPHQEARDIKIALRAIKGLLAKITKEAQCNVYHVCVSGDSNFRLRIPLPSQYKSNRKDLGRPLQLGACKSYLIDFHEAEISQDCEADDLLQIYACQGFRNKDWIVQCTPDKDSLHGPCLVYDWTKQSSPELITGLGELSIDDKNKVRGKGRMFSYFQLAFGDIVDGYKPSELSKAKYGEKAAYNLLKGCKDDKEAIQALVNQYKSWYPSPVTYTAWNGKLYTKNWMEIFQMYFDCVHMRRFTGDRVNVEKMIEKSGVVV